MSMTKDSANSQMNVLQNKPKSLKNVDDSLEVVFYSDDNLPHKLTTDTDKDFERILRLEEEQRRMKLRASIHGYSNRLKKEITYHVRLKQITVNNIKFLFGISQESNIFLKDNQNNIEIPKDNYFNTINDNELYSIQIM